MFVRHGSEVLLETPIFRLRKDRSEHPRTGHQGDYYVLENPDWVNIVALTAAGEVVLVRQWRHGSAPTRACARLGLTRLGTVFARAADDFDAPCIYAACIYVPRA